MNKFFTRFKASEHGGEYLMRYFCVALFAHIDIAFKTDKQGI